MKIKLGMFEWFNWISLTKLNASYVNIYIVQRVRWACVKELSRKSIKSAFKKKFRYLKSVRTKIINDYHLFLIGSKWLQSVHHTLRMCLGSHARSCHKHYPIIVSGIAHNDQLDRSLFAAFFSIRPLKIGSCRNRSKMLDPIRFRNYDLRSNEKRKLPTGVNEETCGVFKVLLWMKHSLFDFPLHATIVGRFSRITPGRELPDSFCTCNAYDRMDGSQKVRPWLNHHILGERWSVFSFDEREHSMVWILERHETKPSVFIWLHISRFVTGHLFTGDFLKPIVISFDGSLGSRNQLRWHIKIQVNFLKKSRKQLIKLCFVRNKTKFRINQSINRSSQKEKFFSFETSIYFMKAYCAVRLFQLLIKMIPIYWRFPL